jgi:CDGSH-type Zn-finger protein/uncharacterized Fe-S cluster protein YjdI
MARKLHTYESDELTVLFDAKRCIHAEECVHGLPGAFDATRRPWIDPSLADPNDMARVIEQCPTGALAYRWRNGADGEKAPDENTIAVQENGPLHVRGTLRITQPDGEVLEEHRAALCRCGQSKDKPFCGNSHIEAGFAHDGSLAANRLGSDESVEDGVLNISLAPGGPLLIRGPVRVLSDGGEDAEGARGALCRCGASASKPFCDGSHK